jgi:uncharacterized membrane protein YdjX (TVP38/TMEM64 family)
VNDNFTVEVDKKNAKGKVDIGNQASKTNLIWIKVLALLLFLGLVMFLYESGAFRFFMDRERIRSFLDSLGPISFLGFIFLQVLQVIAAPIPGEVTGFIGGYVYGPALGVFLSTIGLTIGSWIAFTLARIFGRPFVERFVKNETMDKYDFLLHHKGAFLVFLLFLIPGTPKDFLCYILGLGHLSAKEFLVITTVGRFAGTVLLTLGGDYIRHHQYYRFSALLAVAVVVVFFSLLYKEKIEKIFHLLHSKSTETARKNK